ncbi:MAG: hypothetical protein PHV97_07140 [Candidatus Omnitrophica bacterium]|nr:hypothetical protein [Candidatus Omnitrophota bacterium]
MNMKSIVILVVALMLCPAFAFAANQQEPVAADETVAVAEDAGGDVVGEAVETDELYATETAKDIKAEANEEIKEVKAEDKEAIEDIKEDETEALKEEKM